MDTVKCHSQILNYITQKGVHKAQMLICTFATGEDDFLIELC